VAKVWCDEGRIQ